MHGKEYSKSFPATGLDRPLGFQEVEAPEFLNNRQMKVVMLSALCTSHLYHQEGFLALINSIVFAINLRDMYCKKSGYSRTYFTVSHMTQQTNIYIRI
jgi:hypothetical protein